MGRLLYNFPELTGATQICAHRGTGVKAGMRPARRSLRGASYVRNFVPALFGGTGAQQITRPASLPGGYSQNWLLPIAAAVAVSKATRLSLAPPTAHYSDLSAEFHRRLQPYAGRQRSESSPWLPDKHFGRDGWPWGKGSSLTFY